METKEKRIAQTLKKLKKQKNILENRLDKTNAAMEEAKSIAREIRKIEQQKGI